RSISRIATQCHFNTPEFSVLMLVDSGVDPEGSMLDVIRRSVDERGPIDVVVSQVSEFPEGVNLGLPHYACVLPFDYVASLSREPRRDSITLGPSGLGEACRVAQARYFLPYAHGFRGIGRQPRSAETGKGEASLLSALSVKPTQCLDWLPGGVAVWSR